MNLPFVIQRKIGKQDSSTRMSEELESELYSRFFDIYPSTKWTEDDYVFYLSRYHQWQCTETDRKQDEERKRLSFLKEFYDNYNKTGYLNSLKWNEIDPFFCWPRILFDYPELNEKCHCHDDFCIQNQMLLMIKHPFFVKYMQPKDWKNSYVYWSDILSYHPEGERVCTKEVWENMDVEDWCRLISNQPQFFDKCPMFAPSYKLNDDDQEAINACLPDILIHQPQLFDKITATVPLFDLGDIMDEYQYLDILSIYPDYIFDLADDLDQEEWAQLLVRQPQLWQDCPYCNQASEDAFSAELISNLIRLQPDLRFYIK